MQEITQGLPVAESFIKQTFDKSGEDHYKVKDSIRKHVTFEQADLLSDSLHEQFDKADIVFAQNVLFHMPQDLARKAFAKIVTFLKPHSALFIDGMEIEMRVELIKNENLTPLQDNLREIYMYSRKHIAAKWWNYYWGNEPYSSFAKDKAFRYGTIFLKNSQ
jgi:chemotaxis methyl-accepting protein methylase